MELLTLVCILFWTSVFLVVWTYVGYPAMLWLLSLVVWREPEPAKCTPEVSLIVTAYNEERRIRRKIENCLLLEYPKDKLEIIVVSDASSDRTDDIVREYADKGVQLMRIEKRYGKHYGQGYGIRKSRNDIVVLTDATTFLEPEALRKIVRHYADPKIGCVSGEDRIISAAGSSSGEGAYVKYEMKLRELESKTGSLVGVSGCFYSVRKHLCSHWIDNMSSDFYMPIVTRQNGMRAVLEREAVGQYEVLARPQQEFRRKVRTVVHGLEVLVHFRAILNPFRYGLFALQMASHKLSRWLVPLYLFLILGLNLALAGQHFMFIMTLALQGLLYGLALVAFLIPGLRGVTLFTIPFFFVMVNASILVAWYHYLLGDEFVVWEPTKR